MSQPPTNITCQALSCCELVHSAVPFVKSSNRDIAIPVHFNRHRYCSSSCQNRDQQIRPLLRRIERLIHVLFLEFKDTTNTFPVVSERVYQERYGNWRQIAALDRPDRPGKVSLLHDSFLSLRGRLAFLSLNSYTTVLTVFAALMAYLYKGSSLLPSPAMPNQSLTCSDLDPSIAIHEAHIDNVLSDQEVHVLFLGENVKPLNVAVAAWHSMFRVTATKEDSTTIPARPAQLNGTGIYCDTTAAQYGRAAGLQDAKTYHHRHPDSNTVYYTSLGFHRRVHHLTNVDPDDAIDVRNHIHALSQEACIRTMNNVVHEEIEGMSGCTQWLAMTSGNFEAACIHIADRVRSALLEVAVKLHELYLNPPQGVVFESMEDADRYQEVAYRCLGAGHRACLRALEDRVPETWACVDGEVRGL
ncbi:hypothetical protein G6011_11304 [Alternaria panax]|uniref:Uncharacterized protein n=1 Tax=Alternaria panax TaxID=48097 RepID=A0AAD4IDI8_9PLEO|nr:hypothetical protein G6011_11304 [Alternaria panax]